MFNISPVEGLVGINAGRVLTDVTHAAHAASEAILGLVSLPGQSPTSVKLVMDLAQQLSHMTQTGAVSAHNTSGADETTNQSLLSFVARDVVNALEF